MKPKTGTENQIQWDTFTVLKKKLKCVFVFLEMIIFKKLVPISKPVVCLNFDICLHNNVTVKKISFQTNR